MGEKGNITSDELAAAASASAESGGVGAVIAGAGTTVTAVFEEAGSTVKDKVIDKAADAGIAMAQESWRAHRPPDEETQPEATEESS
ncbi:MAG: hypothetical protein GXY39_08775 [Actinomycetales bacterium]|nr:hypothetical protein [Actinomycetales bacterium]